MTEDDLDRVHDLKTKLWTEVHVLVDAALASETPAVADLVRVQLHEQFRFWRREGVRR